MSTEETKMQYAVNAAVSQAQQIIARARALGSGATAGPADQKRNSAWCEYGYPDQITEKMLYDVWRRGGYAFGAVKILVDTCWSTSPQVIEGVDDTSTATKMTAWDKAVQQSLTARVWHQFKEADRRRLAGRFSALILRIADDKQLHEPASGGQLVEVVPVWAAALEVKERNTTTGNVQMWSYKKPNLGAAGGVTEESIHHSRVFILGDATADAMGFLEPVYNNLVNLEKIAGGGGEAFLKNSARQMHMDFDSTVKLDELAKAHNVPIEGLQKKFNQAARDMNMANDLLLITQGAKVSPMVAATPDPEPYATTNLWEVSCGLGIPQKLLVGNQTGERASTEDNKQMNARGQSRRISELSFEVYDFVQFLIDAKVLPVPPREFLVSWDDLTIPTPADRLAIAKQMTEVNEKFEHTGQAVFTVPEVRVAAGFEPSAAKVQ